METIHLRFVLLISLFMLCSSVFGDEITFTPGTVVDSDMSVTKSGVTMKVTNGTFTSSKKEYRYYKNGVLSFTSSVGNITKIVITCSGSATKTYGPGNMTAEGYSYDAKVGTWKGNSKEVSLNVNAVVWATEVVVTTSTDATVKYTIVPFEEYIENGSVYSDKENASVGEIVTLTAVPNDGYELEEWVLTDEGGNAIEFNTTDVAANQVSFEMQDFNVKYYALFKSINQDSDTDVNITRSVNGVVTTEYIAKGVAVNFADPATTIIGDKTFVGWTTTQIYGTTDVEPTFVTSATADADITYYAVFATAGENGNTLKKVTDVGDVVSGEYVIAAYDGSFYLDNSAASSNEPKAVSLTKENGMFDIVDAMKWNIVVSGGKINVISASDNTLYLWGNSNSNGTRVRSNSTGTNPTKDWYVMDVDSYGVILYNVAQENRERYLGLSENTNANKFWRNYLLSNLDSYKPANLYKIIDGTTYTGYCTTIEKLTPNPEPLTFVAQDNDGSYYATFSSDGVVFFPEAVDVCYLTLMGSRLCFTRLDKEEASVDGVKVEGRFVPANTGVILHSEAKEVAYYTVENKSVEPVSEEQNLLRPASEEMAGNYTFYKLAYGDFSQKTDLGFYYGAAGGAGFSCKEGTAYLAVSKGTEASGAKLFTFDGIASSISKVASDSRSTVYGLDGRRYDAMRRGINIVGGKKYMVK